MMRDLPLQFRYRFARSRYLPGRFQQHASLRSDDDLFRQLGGVAKVHIERVPWLKNVEWLGLRSGVGHEPMRSGQRIRCGLTLCPCARPQNQRAQQHQAESEQREAGPGHRISIARVVQCRQTP